MIYFYDFFCLPILQMKTISKVVHLKMFEMVKVCFTNG